MKTDIVIIKHCSQHHLGIKLIKNNAVHHNTSNKFE